MLRVDAIEAIAPQTLQELTLHPSFWRLADGGGDGEPLFCPATGAGVPTMRGDALPGGADRRIGLGLVLGPGPVDPLGVLGGGELDLRLGNGAISLGWFDAEGLRDAGEGGGGLPVGCCDPTPSLPLLYHTLGSCLGCSMLVGE
jgi:hypothetical protein